jgi:DNA-binding transcriptional LysR family regulator
LKRNCLEYFDTISPRKIAPNRLSLAIRKTYHKIVMLSTLKLKIFQQVVASGSFRQAAEKLLLSQAAISQHVREMEHQLGTSLFIRSTSGVRPTPAGETLLPYANSILDLLAEAEKAVRVNAKEKLATLRLGSTPGIQNYLLPIWLSRFYKRHPTARVSVSGGFTAQIVKQVLENEIDFGMIEGEVQENKRLGSIVLDEVTQWLVVGHSHPWWEVQALPLSALHQQALISRPNNSQTAIWLTTHLQAKNIQPQIVLELDSLEAIKQALINGIGCAILPAYVLHNEIAEGKLRLIGIQEEHFTRTLRVIHTLEHSPSEFARTFWDEILANKKALQ